MQAERLERAGVPTLDFEEDGWARHVVQVRAWVAVGVDVAVGAVWGRQGSLDSAP